MPTDTIDSIPSFSIQMQSQSMSMENCLVGKKKIHTHLIYERLDRTIARKEWAEIYLSATEIHGTFTCSDHCPITLSSKVPTQNIKAFPFRFQNFWCKYQQINTIVKKHWPIRVRGSNMFKLVKKLKSLKYEIKEWSKNSLEIYMINWPKTQLKLNA